MKPLTLVLAGALAAWGAAGAFAQTSPSPRHDGARDGRRGAATVDGRRDFRRDGYRRDWSRDGHRYGGYRGGYRGDWHRDGRRYWYGGGYRYYYYDPFWLWPIYPHYYAYPYYEPAPVIVERYPEPYFYEVEPEPEPYEERPYAQIEPPPRAQPAPEPRFERFTLSATELFDFDKATLRQPQPKLDEIADVLRRNPDIRNVRITGYTDRLGSDEYNLKLSQRRADAVKNYLVSRGVEASRLAAVGRGEANPVVQCSDARKADLIKCLEPNRRVEVERITVERRAR